MFQKILVPLDLTARHQPALQVATEFARQSKGEITLLHVIEVIPGLSMEEEREFYNRLEKKARAHLSRLGGRLKDRSVPWREEVVYGHRVSEALRFATASGVDVIVLTAPRFDPSNVGAGWGSLSYKVSVVAPCPVLLVK